MLFPIAVSFSSTYFYYSIGIVRTNILSYWYYGHGMAWCIIKFVWLSFRFLTHCIPSDCSLCSWYSQPGICDVIVISCIFFVLPNWKWINTFVPLFFFTIFCCCFNFYHSFEIWHVCYIFFVFRLKRLIWILSFADLIYTKLYGTELHISNLWFLASCHCCDFWISVPSIQCNVAH